MSNKVKIELNFIIILILIVDMTTVIESHILVNYEDETKLKENMKSLVDKMFDKFNVTLHASRVMATNTTTGKYRHQTMLTYYHLNTEPETAIEIANYGKKIMEDDLNIRVRRVKVEVLIGENKELNLKANNNQYLECHLKIGKSIPSPEEYKKLASLLLKYGVHLLINYDSKVVAPVTTMRSYNKSLDEFREINKNIIDELKENGFEVHKQHMEYGVYDDNVMTDQGWLFENDKYTEPISECDTEKRLEVPGNYTYQPPVLN
jgi:hypothetical protein